MHLENHRRPAVIPGNWITSADEPWIKEKRCGGCAKTTCRNGESERGDQILPKGFYQRA